MKKMNPTALIVLMLIFILSGCTSSNRNQPEIIADISSCEQCKMLISDERFSAYLTTTESYLFDDIGCMIKYINQYPTEKITIGFMDYENKKWLNPNDAVIIQNKQFTTPMNYGYIAVSKQSELVNHPDNIWKGNLNELKNILRDESHE